MTSQLTVIYGCGLELSLLTINYALKSLHAGNLRSLSLSLFLYIILKIVSSDFSFSSPGKLATPKSWGIVPHSSLFGNFDFKRTKSSLSKAFLFHCADRYPQPRLAQAEANRQS